MGLGSTSTSHRALLFEESSGKDGFVFCAYAAPVSSREVVRFRS